MRTPAEVRAHHESGHAIVTWCLGQHVWKLSIVTDESVRMGKNGFSGGFCRGGATPEPPGVIEHSERPETDLRQAARACSALALTEPPYGWRAALRIGKRLRARTRGLVDHHWPLLARLAAELEEHRELDHVQIARILKPGGPQGLS